MSLEVRLSPRAAAALAIMEHAARAEKTEHPQVRGPRQNVFRIVMGILRDVLPVPSRALHPATALERELVGVRRFGAGQGPRVFYLADPARVLVLMLAERRWQPSAYSRFHEHLAASDFDDAFSEMGIPKPQ